MQNAVVEYLKFGEKVATIDRRAEAPPSREGRPLLPRTNSDGIVSLPLDLATLLGGGKLELGFRGFAIVAEATRAEITDGVAGTVFRSPSMDGSASVLGPQATGFVVAWPDGAEQTDRAWGWRILRGDSPQLSDDPATWPEFQTILGWDLPPSPSPGNWSAALTAGARFSGHFPEVERAPIVVFALQYAAPAWYAPSSNPLALIEGDRHASRYISAFDFVETPEYRHRIAGLFMISQHKGPAPGGGGQDFGTQVFTGDIAHATRFEKDMKSGRLTVRKHFGIDIAGVEHRTPVFAFTSGIASQAKSKPTFSESKDKAGKPVVSSKGGGYGLNVTLKLLHDGLQIFYAHLSTATATGFVRAGQLIGTVGRVSNCEHEKKTIVHGEVVKSTAKASNYIEAPTHLHFEVWSSKGEKRSTALLSSVLGDHFSANLAVVPHNGMRRLLPCDCEGGTGRAYRCAARPEQKSSQDGHDIEAACWARRKGLCPYRSAV